VHSWLKNCEDLYITTILTYCNTLMKFLITNTEIRSETSDKLPFDLFSKKMGPFKILIENRDKVIETESHYSITDGYLRDLNKNIEDLKEQEESTILEITSNWPVPDNITGSFSSCIIDKSNFEITLCNDLIGVYPLYYLKNNTEFYISNSIILLGAVSKCEFDEAGIIQRCLGPEFSNIGSRTILKGCKRLLPGENLKFDTNGIISSKKYDNSLYQNISKPDQSHELHHDFWKAFKKEVAYCLNDSKIVNIALSGGIDSRVVLGAISNDKDITGLTFGGKENYETKIASRLAKIKKADFKSFEQLDLYFPSFEILKKYTLRTEAYYLPSWLEILENIRPKQKQSFLLGDLTTALTGRTIKKFSSKKFRRDNFIKYQVLNRNYEFEQTTKESFENWKMSIIQSYEGWYHQNRLSQFNFNSSAKVLIEALHSDLNELFDRIEMHKLPYQELYDELFNWYTHTHIPMAKQILICNDSYNSYCPSMSIQSLRMSSSIHPNLRLNFRFIKKLFRHKELKKLFSVPTSQAPLVPQNFPDFIKFSFWGLRSIVDEYLIKKLIKSKDITKRYRLFKSINWARIYQNPDMKKNLKDYFKRNHLGDEFFKNILNLCVQRKKLNHWPFANLDIMNAAGLNMEIDLIKSLRQEEDEV